jgi:hypothetical protein
LLQPAPLLAQSSPGARANEAGTQRGARPQAGQVNARTPEEICAEAEIFDAVACQLHIQKLEAAAAADAAGTPDAVPTAEEAQAQAVEEADTEAEEEAEALAEEAAEAEAEAAAEDAAEAAAEDEATRQPPPRLRRFGSGRSQTTS